MRGIKGPGPGCNFQGALDTLTRIEGVVPIVHSTAGCVIQHYHALRAGGSLGAFLEGFEVPSSNVWEKQIIFGGASRLREQMKNAVKVFSGDLYVVLPGCESEMVGDDAAAMTAELAGQGAPVICYEGAGFKGDAYSGYAGVTEAIFAQLPGVAAIPAKGGERSVNILGLVPGQDPYWQGNLAELGRIFHRLGVRVNTFFGSGQGLESWKRAYRADLTIVVSRWGIRAAKLLEDRYGVPSLELNGAFLGEQETGSALRKAAALLGEERELEPFLQAEKSRFVYALRQIRDYYYAHFPRNYGIAGDEGAILRYGKFLGGVLGFSLKAAIITDAPAGEENPRPAAELEGLTEKVYCSKDRGEIAEIIVDTRPQLILAGAPEKALARRLGIPLLRVSSPAGRMMLNRSNLGYTGALTVLEELWELFVPADPGPYPIR
ncbi:hydrogenase [Treponema sp. TIM-1]|uniref:nitrogenase component 1 n=1 Tax=Treponema sp. TIM-1 TaxID=2898417 RepID=UPI003980F4CF